MTNGMMKRKTKFTIHTLTGREKKKTTTRQQQQQHIERRRSMVSLLPLPCLTKCELYDCWWPIRNNTSRQQSGTQTQATVKFRIKNAGHDGKAIRDFGARRSHFGLLVGCELCATDGRTRERAPIEVDSCFKIQYTINNE